MFEVEKPRKFHYEPRFYDPEKEKWEALKKKYAIEQERKEKLQNSEETNGESNGEKDDLAYFEERLRTLDRQKRRQSSRLSWKDLYRKREMPTFNYQPRFSGQGAVRQSEPSDTAATGQGEAANDELTQKYSQPKHRIKIHRRFDISDPDYMKPISGTKIIFYCFLVFILLTFIFAF